MEGPSTYNEQTMTRLHRPSLYEPTSLPERSTQASPVRENHEKASGVLVWSEHRSSLSLDHADISANPDHNMQWHGKIILTASLDRQPMSVITSDLEIPTVDNHKSIGRVRRKC